MSATSLKPKHTRLRAARACSRCRKRKIKCTGDGEIGSCVGCQKAKSPCEFESTKEHSYPASFAMNVYSLREPRKESPAPAVRDIMNSHPPPPIIPNGKPIGSYENHAHGHYQMPFHVPPVPPAASHPHSHRTLPFPEQNTFKSNSLEAFHLTQPTSNKRKQDFESSSKHSPYNT